MQLSQAELIHTDGFRWGSWDIPENQPLCFNFGVSRIWLQIDRQRLGVAHEITETVATTTQAIPFLPSNKDEELDLEWHYWALPKATRRLTILPAMPKRPLVLRLEPPFMLMEDQITQFLAEVPLWVAITVAEAGDKPLVELPILPLTDAWFGDFFEGEICYGIHSHSAGINEQGELEGESAYLAICPLSIQNKGMEPLNIEKIRLTVENMAIYESRGNLWTSPVAFSDRGSQGGNHVEISDKAPEECPHANMIQPARTPVHRTMTIKGIGRRLGELPGMKLWG